jgi:hypothetical protein
MHRNVPHESGTRGGGFALHETIHNESERKHTADLYQMKELCDCGKKKYISIALVQRCALRQRTELSLDFP